MEKEQIIKALECCQTQYERNCHKCPYEVHKKRFISVVTCESMLRKDLLELIKELTEENERLNAIPEQLHKEMSERMVEERNIERKLAVRKFAERVKNRIHSKLSYHGWYLKETVIDQIAKEILNENTEDDLK